MIISFRALVCRVGLLLTLLTASSRGAVTFSISPSTVSIAYSGTITLQVAGLTNTESVVIQKFLDANTNGTVDAADSLVQQFQLKDGQASVIGGVTNLNVPGDLDSATGQITAALHFYYGDLMQNLAGKYAFKLSSPVGHFKPITNFFTVTNLSYAQSLTGNVTNNSATNVPNAIVLLFANVSGSLFFQGGTVANNSGYYSLPAPPGTYALFAFKSNYVAGVSAQITLTNGVISTNTLTLSPATQSISGKIVDAATNSIRLPGIGVFLESTNGLTCLAFTDTNGNFTARVTTNVWTVEPSIADINLHGYLGLQNDTNVNTQNGDVSGVTNAVRKANALFYGSVRDDQGQSLPFILFNSADDNGRYSDTIGADLNGNYFSGALGGIWRLQPFVTNSVVSPGPIRTNLTAGQSVLVNFIIKSATNRITGYVRDYNGNAITNVQVSATASFNGTNYQTLGGITDASGNYLLDVANGTWTVSLDCSSDSSNSLSSLGTYECPTSQNLSLAGTNGVVNFTVQHCGDITVTTTNLPNGQVGSYYSAQLQASSCQVLSNWSLVYGVTLTTLYDPATTNYPAGTPLYFKPTQLGYLLSTFSYGIQQNGTIFGNGISYTFTPSGPACGYFQNLSATVNVSVPLTQTNVVTINGKRWDVHPTTVSNGVYVAVLTFHGVQDQLCVSDSYTAKSGTLMIGTNSGAVTLLGNLNETFVHPATGKSASISFVAPYTGGTNISAWIGGAQYLIAPFGAQTTTNPPPGLVLSPNGLLNGTPTAHGTFNFTVHVSDVASNIALRALSLTILPSLTATLGSAAYSITNRQFQMIVNGATGQNYTLQMSTNLSSTNWTSILVTNPSTNPFLLSDPGATNPTRFYRLLLGP